MESRADRWPSALSYLFGVDGSLARLLRGGGVGSLTLSLRAPEVHGVHGVLVAKSVLRFIGNFLVWLSSGSCSTPSMYSLSTTSFTCLFSLLASRIKGYNLRRFSSTSWGNCSFTHILLPFSLSGARFRTSSRSLKKLNLATMFLGLVLISFGFPHTVYPFKRNFINDF